MVSKGSSCTSEFSALKLLCLTQMNNMDTGSCLCLSCGFLEPGCLAILSMKNSTPEVLALGRCYVTASMALSVLALQALFKGKFSVLPLGCPVICQAGDLHNNYIFCVNIGWLSCCCLHILPCSLSSIELWRVRKSS